MFDIFLYAYLKNEVYDQKSVTNPLNSIRNTLKNFQRHS